MGGARSTRADDATSWCVSSSFQCGAPRDWIIVDNFTLNAKAIVTGLENWNTHGNIGDYVSTNWFIWSSRPDGTTTPLAFGNSVADVALDGSFIHATVSNLSVSLEAGDYWIGFNHQLSGPIPWTYVASRLSNERNALQIFSNGVIGDGGLNTSGEPDMAFRIHATAVPEPGSIALLGAGGLILAGVARRRARR